MDRRDFLISLLVISQAVSFAWIGYERLRTRESISDLYGVSVGLDRFTDNLDHRVEQLEKNASNADSEDAKSLAEKAQATAEQARKDADLAHSLARHACELAGGVGVDCL